MKKKTREEISGICGLFNAKRMQYKNKAFTSDELIKEFKEVMCSKYVREMIKSNFFIKTRVGHNNLYEFTSTPIHESKFHELFSSIRKANRAQKENTIPSEDEETRAIAVLKKLGYRLSKPVGLDIEKFKTENPYLYNKYRQWREM